MKSFKKCGVSNALAGTAGDVLFQGSESSDSNNSNDDSDNSDEGVRR